jgi:hypothetical protein
MAQRHYPFGMMIWCSSFVHVSSAPMHPHKLKLDALLPQATRCTLPSPPACRPGSACSACRWPGCPAASWSLKSQVRPSSMRCG